MNFVVSFCRENYIANVKAIEKIQLPNEDITDYFETKYQINLFKNNDYMLTAYCQMQYDEKPDILDVTKAISQQFNYFLLCFAKNGKLQ